MVVNNSHLTTLPQLGHQGQLACTTITTHSMLLNMHRLVVTKLKGLGSNIPKWCNTHICLSTMVLQLGFSHFLLQSQSLLPLLLPQVKMKFTHFLILYHKSILTISRDFNYMQINVVGVTAATGVTGASGTNSEQNSSS